MLADLFLSGPPAVAEIQPGIRSSSSLDSADTRAPWDATEALTAAVERMNKRASAGKSTCLYLSSGVFVLRRQPPTFVRAGCVIGAGANQTIIKLAPEFRGDVFSWSEAWQATSPGPRISGVTIRSEERSANIQNGLVFYDRNDRVVVEDVDIEGLNGTAIALGRPKNSAKAYTREARFRAIRLFGDGGEHSPALDIGSSGDGITDASNEIDFDQVDIYGSNGVAALIHNSGTGVVRDLKFSELRIEGEESGTKGRSLLQIGSVADRGVIAQLKFTETELINPPAGFAALEVVAPNELQEPYGIVFEGSIGGGNPRGKGILISYLRGSIFQIEMMNTRDKNLTVTGSTRDVIVRCFAPLSWSVSKASPNQPSIQMRDILR